MSFRASRLLMTAVALVGWQAISGAQWTHRYPKVAGYNHHVYLEGYDLPVVAVGPTDPAPSPDGRSLVFAARGWLWIQDLATGEARRITRGAGLDARPAWSPDGKTIAFVRDDTRDTSIVEIEVASRREKVLVSTPALDLDPVYSRDGQSLFYSSAVAGDLDLYRLDLRGGASKRLSEDQGIELRPQPLPDGTRVIFVGKQSYGDSVSILDLGDGTRRVLADGWVASQMRPALDPSGRLVVVGLPGSSDAWALWLYDVAGGPPIQLTTGQGLPIMPAWSADGSSVYYAEADRDRQFRLWRVGRGGGTPVEVTTLSWDWGEPTARVRIRTQRGGAPLPARVHVADRDGHPAVPDNGQSWFDGQNGRTFFYSAGSISVEVPAGSVRVMASAGFTTPPASATAEAAPGQTATIDLPFTALANPRADGWYSGDHHFHMNYGGPYSLQPQDLVPMMQGEDLDVATPLMANLHTRLVDLKWLDWRRASPPLIAFGQEIRPHFLGHIGVIGISAPFWPWYWGPGYPVFGRDDRPLGEALAEVRRQGGVGAYMHPVSRRDPFPPGQPPGGLPLSLVPDALHGDLDTLEVACLWSDEFGTSDVWYRLLNVGVPIGPSAGTDVMANFYRMMAVGTTRVYVHVNGPLTFERYLDGLRAGRSFVTTGPLLTFGAQGQGPGSAISSRAGDDVPWELSVTSPIAFEKVEVIVNGAVVWSEKGLGEAGRRTWSGKVKAPSGGWIAARVTGGAVEWPVMDSAPFAHTGALWFNRVGSTEPQAARLAATDLLAWMDVADKRLVEGYAGAEIPVLQKRFAETRQKLEVFARGGTGSGQ